MDGQLIINLKLFIGHYKHGLYALIGENRS